MRSFEGGQAVDKMKIRVIKGVGEALEDGVRWLAEGGGRFEGVIGSRKYTIERFITNVILGQLNVSEITV